LFLHFAPEPAIARRLARLEHVQYLRVDCRPEAVDARVDIHRLPLADASFDFIYASHVLNCVRDDQQALRELHRVLKPRGRLIAQMSVYNAPATIEYEHSNPGDGCFREYGFDVVTRLEEAGFDVTVEQVIDRMPADEVRRLGMDDTDGSRRQNDLYICRKISA
jgi:SAM-dependent methyltransferase